MPAPAEAEVVLGGAVERFRDGVDETFWVGVEEGDGEEEEEEREDVETIVLVPRVVVDIREGPAIAFNGVPLPLESIAAFLPSPVARTLIASPRKFLSKMLNPSRKSVSEFGAATRNANTRKHASKCDDPN